MPPGLFRVAGVPRGCNRTVPARDGRSCVDAGATTLEEGVTMPPGASPVTPF